MILLRDVTSVWCDSDSSKVQLPSFEQRFIKLKYQKSDVALGAVSCELTLCCHLTEVMSIKKSLAINHFIFICIF